MRVLIIDDSAMMRRVLRKLIEAGDGFEVVGTANDGREGVEKTISLRPDLVTLDVEMPEMDGIDALRRITKVPSPPAVLMCSTLTAEGSDTALKALSLGAADVIAKDPDSLSVDAGAEVREQLLKKLKAIGEGHRRSIAARSVAKKRGQPAGRRTAPLPTLDASKYDLVCIGSSTGGPPALESVLSRIPEGFPLPVVIAQHMPELFTRSLAGRLNDHCGLEVVHAESDTKLEPGMAAVIKGGKHGKVARSAGRLLLRIGDEPADALYRPSVDALLASQAEATGARSLSIVLTGMGEDGSQGALAVSERGGKVISQEATSCVVFGMPRAVEQVGASDVQLTPDEIGEVLAAMTSYRRRIPA
ncbi:MAG: chemotaxis-specific protein-glutamate methyltransferase CheB [Planctomycetota bacterium]